MPVKNFIAIVFCLLFFSRGIFCQATNNELPVSVFSSPDTTKPVLFYISGDGGWNKFSNSFVQNLNAKGYEVVGLNAREYFWHKKDARQTGKDVSAIIATHMKNRRVKSFILIGYSFGADVMPFAATHGSDGVMDSLKYIILMSPSVKTDFEVHVSELLGIGSSSGESVTAEINKITKPLLFVFGDKEDNFPLKDIRIKNYKTATLPGGHHYDGDPAAVCNLILPYIQ
jgi:type IV secretory pathway VirJ component